MIAKILSQYLQVMGIVPNLAALLKKITFHPNKVSIKEKVSSYTSVTHVFLDSILLVHALPLTTDDKKYIRLNKSRWTAVKIIFDIGFALLQLILILKWFDNQRSNSSERVVTDNWKNILMTFLLVLFIGTCFGLLHLIRFPREIVCVLNCSNHLEMERNHERKGRSKSTLRRSMYVCTLLIFSVFLFQQD